MHSFVVVSGLPASGKTTLAQALAAELSFPCIDKDAFLEELFEQEPPHGLGERDLLSRRADELFQAEAMRSRSAVLSSWWLHPGSARRSGTSTDWLLSPGVSLAEVHCLCSAEAALNRFTTRRRHPRHADAQRDRGELAAQFESAAALGPIFPDRAILQDTGDPVPRQRMLELAKDVQALISRYSEA
jgi:predicted kinase